MHIVLDVLVAAIVVFTVIGAVRKGFVRSLLSLVGLVLSLVLTYSFAVPFGGGERLSGGHGRLRRRRLPGGLCGSRLDPGGAG